MLVAIAVQLLLALVTNLKKLRPRLEDTDLYYRYATMALAGKVPYRDYRVEYPPLAVPLFLVPRVVSTGLVGFKVAFAIEMLLLNAATVYLVAAWVERRQGLERVPSRLAWYTLFFLFLSRLIVSRYDPAPMLLGFAAAVSWFSGRNALGGLAAGLGVLAKIYPGSVALIASVWDLTRTGTARGRGMIVFVITAALGTALWLASGGVRGVSQSLGYHLERGLEYASLYSGAQMLAAKLVGAEIVISRDHASFSSITPWSARLTAWVMPIQLATLLIVWGVFLGRGMRDGVRYSAAAVLALIVTGKVFSPQYLLWLMPFLAALEGPVAPRALRTFALGCLATLLAPAGLGYLPRTNVWIILAYNVKNLIFLWLLAMMVFGPEASPSEERVTSASNETGSGKSPE